MACSQARISYNDLQIVHTESVLWLALRHGAVTIVALRKTREDCWVRLAPFGNSKLVASGRSDVRFESLRGPQRVELIEEIAYGEN